MGEMVTIKLTHPTHTNNSKFNNMNTDKVNIEAIREVVEIKRMFEHVHMSCDLHKYPKDNLKFFGFPEGTVHYHIFRAIQLNEMEVLLEWRYRDNDTEGLKRCLTLLAVYKALTTKHTRVNRELLTIRQLESLELVSKSSSKAA